MHSANTKKYCLFIKKEGIVSLAFQIKFILLWVAGSPEGGSVALIQWACNIF